MPKTFDFLRTNGTLFTTETQRSQRWFDSSGKSVLNNLNLDLDHDLNLSCHTFLSEVEESKIKIMIKIEIKIRTYYQFA